MTDALTFFSASKRNKAIIIKLLLLNRRTNNLYKNIFHLSKAVISENFLFKYIFVI